jgi:hypothetical protein
MDRALWRRNLAKTYSPRWPCPGCKGGTLALVPKSVVWQETDASKKSRRHEEFDPDWITYAFTGWLRCTNSKCEQQCAIAGEGGVEPAYDPEDGSTTWADYFAPKYLFPMPDVIRVPAKCPDNVAACLRHSFAAMWNDHKGAANHLRSAIEQLLDQLGVQRRRKTKNGTFMDLSLHARIDIYRRSRPASGASLMALKWVGNAGSHGSHVTLTDILDAYEIFEHTLEEVVEERSKRVSTLAKKITRKHSKRHK